MNLDEKLYPEAHERLREIISLVGGVAVRWWTTDGVILTVETDRDEYFTVPLLTAKSRRASVHG